MYWYVVESILPFAQYFQLPTTKQLARCSSLQSLHPFFSKHHLLWWPKSSILVSSVESTLSQNALMVFFCIFQTLKFVLRSFFLATLPCRSLLFKACCIIVLWTARPCLLLLCSSFAVMCGFLWAFLTMSRAVLSEIFLSLPDLAWISTVPFIFHFIILFLTVEIGSFKHWESFCSRLPLGGNEPSSFWNLSTTGLDKTVTAVGHFRRLWSYFWIKRSALELYSPDSLKP